MKQLRFFAAILLLLAMLLSATAGLAISPPATAWRRGDETSPRIAITVDDCYKKEYVTKILDLCDEYQIHITFCPVGKTILPEDGDLWRRIVESGHEIANHTYAHDNMPGPRMTAERMLREFERTEEALNTALGYEYFMRCYRPPYGKAGGVGHKRQCTRYGYPDIILWTVSQTNPDKAFAKAENGSIFLFHAQEKDYDCLVKLIPMLLDAGFEPVTATELLQLEPMTRTRNGVSITSNGGVVQESQISTPEPAATDAPTK